MLGSLHTLLNFFSVALVTMGMIYEIIGRRSTTRQFLIHAGWMTLIIGACFTALSVITGFVVESSAYIPKDAALLAVFHKFISIATFVFIIIVIGFRLLFLAKLDNTEHGAGIRGAYLTLQVITICLTLTASVIGTQLVHRYGVGVEPIETLNRYMPPPTQQNGISVDTTEFRF
jgi:uncharacterized membrane protein